MSLQTPQVRTPAQWESLQCQHLGLEAQWPQTLIAQQLRAFEGWAVHYDAQGKQARLVKNYPLKGFDQVKQAVQGLSELADAQDHHPHASFSYDFLEVTWSTHSAEGLSANDWICAALSDAVIRRIG